MTGVTVNGEAAQLYGDQSFASGPGLAGVLNDGDNTFTVVAEDTRPRGCPH